MLTFSSCQPVPVRCKAPRIKTSFTLGHHSLHWAEMAPVLVTEEGTRLVPWVKLNLKVSGPLSAEEASWGLDWIKKKKKIQIKAFANTCAYSKACTKAWSINKLDPREQSWACRIGAGWSYVFICSASNSSKHLLVPGASLIKQCGQCCILFWFLPSVFVFLDFLFNDLVTY